MVINNETYSLADDIATRGNALIEALGFDTECNSIGYESSTGAFLEVQGDDMNEGLTEFFIWMESEFGANNNVVNTLKNDYQTYLNLIQQ